MGVDAMIYVELPQGVEYNDDTLRQLSFDICEAVGHRAFWFDKDEDKHALRFCGRDDAEGLEQTTGQLIDVHTLSRYYGPFYERGPLQDFVMIAEWFERRIPGCKVFYGGDSGGVSLFDKAERDKLLDHWATVGHKPYTGCGGDRMARGGYGTDGIQNPTCEFCRHPMTRYGYGFGYGMFTCDGCKASLTTRDGGKTWGETEKDLV